jgi:hypothetical protein
MPGLRGQLVRLAHREEGTREHLLPLLFTAAGQKTKVDFRKRVMDLSAYAQGGYSRSEHAANLRTLAQLLQSGTAFVKDPNGVFLDHVDLSTYEKYLASSIRSSFAEDAEDWPQPTEEEAFYMEDVQRRLRGLKVTIKPVQGKTSPGFKITTRPDVYDALEQAELGLKALEIGLY